MSRFRELCKEGGILMWNANVNKMFKLISKCDMDKKDGSISNIHLVSNVGTVSQTTAIPT